MFSCRFELDKEHDLADWGTADDWGPTGGFDKDNHPLNTMVSRRFICKELPCC